MDPQVKYLLSLEAIRERSSIVYDAAKNNKLTNFDFHPERLDAVATYVSGLIERDFGPDRYATIPPHGRWQHFEVGNVPRIEQINREWKHEGCNIKEMTRRLIDLFFVSVLLDAGAGDTWSFTEPGTTGKYERSEGIAVATLHMFKAGAFSGSNGAMVTSQGLKDLSSAKLAEGFQNSSQNEMVGVNSRAALLNSLGASLAANPEVFGTEGRPGNLMDFMDNSAGPERDLARELDVKVLWDLLQSLLLPAWPSDRTNIAGVPLGDAWPLSTLRKSASAESVLDASTIQPFHKLTQWLTYSLMVPFERQKGHKWTYKWINTELLTGLPEYRNGGLFVDMEVLTLKPAALKAGLSRSSDSCPVFDPSDDVIVEWRAMTVSLLDELYNRILTIMKSKDSTIVLSMAQVLESGTWKAGREIAARERPTTKSSPIVIQSDGTVF